MSKHITIGSVEFISRIDKRTGTIAVTSIHPYDETEYHWARQSASGGWTVYRAGRKVATYEHPMSDTEIAEELTAMDKAAKLVRTGGIY